MRRLILIIALLLCICASASAATYYVDFSGGADTNNGTATGTPWKHVKGMTGCTNTCNSTTLNANDVVTFKGGTTWTASYPWSLVGGTSGGNVVYTTDHTWYTGGAWSQPIFDDGAADPGATGMLAGANYSTLNDLKFVNCGTASTANTDKCLVYTSNHDITVTNCTFSTESWITIYLVFGSAGSYSNFTFTGNDFSHTSGAVWVGTAQASTSAHTFTYNSNTFHDFSSQIGGTSPNGVHGDGAWHSFGVPSSDSTQYVDGVTFCNNRFYGDFRRSFGNDGAMTAFFFAEGSFGGTLCNNDFSYTPAQASMFQAEIYMDGYNNTHHSSASIYNNSLAAIGTNAMSNAFDLARQTGSTFIFKNNAIYSPQYCNYQEDAGSAAALTSDYNVLNCSGGFDYNGSFKTFGQWQALGFDAHSITSNPSWVSAPGNEHLNSGSPAISAGVDLTGLGITILNSDRDSVARPSGSAWDIGAYQYAAGDVTAPVPGNSGTITTASITATTLTLNWTKATDAVSAQSTLQYEVRRSLSNNMGSVANAEANGTIANAYTTDIATANETGLTASTLYYFNVIVKDEAGNKAVYTTKSVTTAPIISTLSPANGSTGMSITGALVATFSASVTAIAAKNITIKKTSDNSTIETIAANNTGIVTISGANVTIAHAVALLNSTSYYVQIDADAFEDASSNQFAGISTTNTWQFTTVAASAPGTGPARLTVFR